MKNKHLLLSLFIVLFSTQEVSSQVTKNIVLEQFTNTRCGVCANRNPGLFTNLNNNPEVLHLTVHPSSPYRNCVLNNHNGTENDARTNYYGIFGGTPRIVIQGKVVGASTNYGSSAIFTEHQSQTSAIGINVETLKSNADSLVAKIVITAAADNTLGSLRLYAPAVEDTVFYNAPNGEKTHYNVFRKVLLDELTTVPATSGDSIVLYARVAQHADRDQNQMYVMAILQDANTKAVEQAAISTPIRTKKDETATVKLIKNTDYSFGPNPVRNVLTLDLKGSKGSIRLLNSYGQEVDASGEESLSTIDLGYLSEGIYWLQISTDKGIATEKILKQ